MTWLIGGNSNATTTSFLGTTTPQPLVIKTNNKEAMRIASADGDVSIGDQGGTRSPDYKLDVQGILNADDIRKGGTQLVGSQWKDGDGSISYDPPGFSQGLVGIGTTDPFVKLHVVDPDGLGIRLDNGGELSLRMDLSGSDSEEFFNLESVGADLHINGSGVPVHIRTLFGNVIRLETVGLRRLTMMPARSDSEEIIYHLQSLGADLHINNSGSGFGNERVHIRHLRSTASFIAQGKVGIGMTPTATSQKLTLGSGNVLLPNANAGTDGHLYFGGTTDTGQLGMRLFGGRVNPGPGEIHAGFIDVKTDTPTDGLRIRVDTGTGGTERMRVTAGGNVGIGTGTTPLGARLTVAGGDITWGNNSRLQTDQGGSIELGADRDTVGTGSPYIDFHFQGLTQDFNTRIQNDANGQLTISAGTLRATGNAIKPGGGSWGVGSDIQLKKNVEPLKGALGKLLRLRGKRFEWKEPEKQGNLVGPQLGLVAQEVEEVFPEWVDTDPSGHKILTVRGFEALTVEAFRELKAENETLKMKNEELEDRIKILELTMPKGQPSGNRNGAVR